MIPNTHSVTSVAPIALLGVALVALLFFEVPAPNKELLTAIISGLLGYLSRPRDRAQQPTEEAP